MSDEEQLVAEQVVLLDQAGLMTVRISQNEVEEFWRVDVSRDHAGQEDRSTTTVAAGDSFMMNLIEGAVGGDALAWRHLAHWGQDNLVWAAGSTRRFA